ncbi:MAG: hypothetical protein M3Q69_20710, partial [Acidobacteriota bacterium]|nr:hypothetical protein [Acidobacteriota bacterium]
MNERIRSGGLFRPLSIATAASVIFVLFAYVFFATAGELEFRRAPWYSGLYASLTEGFLRGQLSMAHDPEPELLRLPNPYRIDQRGDIPYVWDASLYRGRYYLYFSPVPVLLFTLPFRVAARGYATDPLATLFFTSWAFLACVAFLRRVMRGRASLPLWILLAGVGNIVPYFLLDTRVYDVAASCGMAMATTWAYTLLRFLESPSTRSATWMGLFLGLTIATRPNMIVLLAVAAFALWKYGTRKLAIAVALPVVVIGSAYAAYNYARFGSPFETGLSYQLTVISMRHETPCRLCTPSDLSRFFNTLMHYVFLPPKFVSRFPFVEMRFNDVDRAVSFPALPEQVTGIFAITPLTMFATAFAALLVLARHNRETHTRVALLLLSSGWLVLLSLSTCRWVTARYSLDFAMLMLLATPIAIEEGLRFLRDANVSTRPLRIAFTLLACYSIVVGLLLGFTGRDSAFERLNPTLLSR